MKKLFPISLLCFAFGCAGQPVSSTMWWALTNWNSTLSTNATIVTPVAASPTVEGQYALIGLPKYFAPNSLGIWTNVLLQGNYRLDIVGLTFQQPIYFQSPGNGLTNSVFDFQISGGQFFVTRLVNTNAGGGGTPLIAGTNTTVTFSNGTNTVNAAVSHQEVINATNGMVLAATNSVNATNLVSGGTIAGVFVFGGANGIFLHGGLTNQANMLVQGNTAIGLPALEADADGFGDPVFLTRNSLGVATFDITSTGVINGNGSGLTNIPGSIIVGAVAQATHATNADYAASVAGTNIIAGSGPIDPSLIPTTIFNPNQFSVTAGPLINIESGASVTNITVADGITGISSSGGAGSWILQPGTGTNGGIYNYGGVFIVSNGVAANMPTFIAGTNGVGIGAGLAASDLTQGQGAAVGASGRLINTNWAQTFGLLAGTNNWTGTQTLSGVTIVANAGSTAPTYNLGLDANFNLETNVVAVGSSGSTPRQSGFSVAPSVSSGSTKFIAAFGGSVPSSTETNSVQFMAVASGTVKNLFVDWSTLGAGTNTTITFDKNGSAQTVTVSINGTGNPTGSVSDTTHSFTFVQGDAIDIKITGNNASATAGTLNVAFQY